MTRRGRFSKIDPLQGRRLPSWGRWLGVLAWGVLLGESIRRAKRAAADSDE